MARIGSLNVENTARERRRYVLLDRDGTLIVYRPYLARVDQVELVPGVAEGLRGLAGLGLGLAVLTNQSGISRGYFSRDEVDRIHGRIREELAEAGVVIEDFYLCPHVPEDRCGCRKPQPGLALRAARDLRFDLQQSFVIGDNACDVELGINVGATTFRLDNQFSVDEREPSGHRPDFVIGDLREAAAIIAERLAAEEVRG